MTPKCQRRAVFHWLHTHDFFLWVEDGCWGKDLTRWSYGNVNQVNPRDVAPKNKRSHWHDRVLSLFCLVCKKMGDARSDLNRDLPVLTLWFYQANSGAGWKSKVNIKCFRICEPPEVTRRGVYRWLYTHETEFRDVVSSQGCFVRTPCGSFRMTSQQLHFFLSNSCPNTSKFSKQPQTQHNTHASLHITHWSNPTMSAIQRTFPLTPDKHSVCHSLKCYLICPLLWEVSLSSSPLKSG